MSDWAHLRDEDESEAVQESRRIAQRQFVDLSTRFVAQSQQLRSANERIAELEKRLNNES